MTAQKLDGKYRAHILGYSEGRRVIHYVCMYGQDTYEEALDHAEGCLLNLKSVIA